jgi:hypothetical protein
LKLEIIYIKKVSQPSKIYALKLGPAFVSMKNIIIGYNIWQIITMGHCAS